jgi:hypothetical protein
VDDGVETTELVGLACYGRRPGDGGEVPADSSLSAGCGSEGVAAPALIAPVQDDLMALLDQELGRNETEAVR